MTSPGPTQSPRRVRAIELNILHNLKDGNGNGSSAASTSDQHCIIANPSDQYSWPTPHPSLNKSD